MAYVINHYDTLKAANNIKKARPIYTHEQMFIDSK